MPINVLRRHGLKAPSTPYSSCRSSIQHLHHFETTNYSDFFNLDYIVEANAFSGNAIYNIRKQSERYFKQGAHKYYEMTHHDIRKTEDSELLRRRVIRMIKARASKDHHILFYHHRSTNGFELSRGEIKKCLGDILGLYNNASAICISQKIIPNARERGIEATICGKAKITFSTLKTLQQWSGYDLDLFFGKCDDDLLKKALEVHAKHFCSIIY